MTMLRAFVCFMLVTSTAAVYKIQGHLDCGHWNDQKHKITTDNAEEPVWVELYYMEPDEYHIYCTPFHVGGHYYAGANQVRVGSAKGIECINQCIHLRKWSDPINAVTFYHTHPGCYCVRNNHYVTTGDMSTCLIKRENDMLAVNRTQHGEQVSRNGRQIHSLNNDDNFIHLEGTAGRTGIAFWLMVKVTNHQCGRRTWSQLERKDLASGKTWTYAGDDLSMHVDLGKIFILRNITIVFINGASGDTSDYKVTTWREKLRGSDDECTRFRYATGEKFKLLRCTKMTMARFVSISRYNGNYRLKDIDVNVYEADPTELLDVSSRKPTKTSTSADTGERAIDGDYATYVKASSIGLRGEQARTHPTYWSVDLKEVIIIGRIIISIDKKFYASTDMKVLTNRWNFLEYSTGNPVKWTVCKEVGKDLNLIGANSIVHTEVTCEKTTKARTVRIQNPNGQDLYLNEVEVFEDAMWFRPPYDCFDAAYPKLGCKDLTFNMWSGEVKKGKKGVGNTQGSTGGYYTIKSKMFNGYLYAFNDSRHINARVLTELYNDTLFEALRIYSKGDFLLWQIVKEGSGNYYKIISKTTGKPIYVTDANRKKKSGDIIFRYVMVGDDRYTSQGNRALWKLVKRKDSYYSIDNVDLRQPIFATSVEHYAAMVPTNFENKYNGNQIWEITKV